MIWSGETRRWPWRPKAGSALCAALVCAGVHPAHADAPPPAVRQQIEDFFAAQFWDPQNVDCANSAHIFVGYRHFYVTVFPDGVHQGAIMAGRADDPVGSIAAKIRLLCGF